LVPADWKSQSIGSALTQCFTGTPTTAFSMVRLRPAFPFITSPPQPFAKPASLTTSSNCRASASDAHRSERFRSYHMPCFYIGAAFCGRNTSNSFQRVKRYFRKWHVNRMRQQVSILSRDRLIEEAQVRIELVIRRILRRVTNALIKPLQFFRHSELHKKCLNKFGGTTDLKRLQHDWFAMSRGS